MDQLLVTENEQLKALLRFVVKMSGLLLKYQQQLEEVRAKCKCDGVEWREPLGEQLKKLYEKAEEIKLNELVDKVIGKGEEEMMNVEVKEVPIEDFDEVNEGNEKVDENVDETTDGVARRVKRLRRSSTRGSKRRRVVDDDEKDEDRSDESDSDYDVNEDDERNFKVDYKPRWKQSKIDEKKCLEMGIDLTKYVRSPSGLVLGLDRPKKIPGQYLWLCDYPGCDFYTRTRMNLVLHAPKHTGMKIKCDDCDKTFVNLRGLEKHKKWEHSTVLTGSNKCSQPGCDYVTKTWYELEGHEAKHTGRVFLCDLCGKTCANSKAVEDHKKRAHQEKSLLCEYPGCGKRFGDKKYFEVHQKQHLGIKPHACPWPGCDYRSLYSMGLKNHISTIHSDERPFTCPVEGCAQKLATADGLKRHKYNVHRDVRPFHCSWPGCGAAYKIKGKFLQHERTHSGDKPFACDWPGCEFRAISKDQVTCHRKTVHEKIKNLECPWPGCDKRFYNKVHLNAHHNTHTGERPFKCQDPDCQMTFISQNYMHKHFKKKHQT